MKSLIKNIGLIQLLAILIAVVFVGSLEIRHKDLSYALDGWSPLEWTARVLKPDNFKSDYSNGVDNYKHSSIMWIYPALEAQLNIPTLQAAKVSIFLEILITALLFCALFNFFIKASPEKKWAYLFLVLVVLASNIRYANGARFSLPVWTGLYYVYADLFRISGVLLLLGKKYRRAALAFSVAFTIHPAITVQALIIAFIAILPDYKYWVKNRSFYLSAFGMLSTMSVWTYYNFNSTSVQSILIPKESWISLTQLMSCHWYPNSLGLFTDLSYETGFPLIATFIVSFYFVAKSDSPFRRHVIFGLIGATLLTIFGWINAEYIQNQTLIKLSFQRSSDFVYFLGLPFVIQGITTRWNSRSITLAALISTYLVAIYFFYGPNLYLVIALICFDQYISKKKDSLYVSIAAIATIATITLSSKLGLSPYWTQSALTGSSQTILCFLGALLIAFTAAQLKEHWANILRVTSILVATTIMFVNFGTAKLWPSERINRGTAYKEAQLWAKENTASTSLFMVDPTIIYGWRDYSERSSYGNFREWLHTSWLYNSDVNFYNEGFRRFSFLNVDIRPYLKPPVIQSTYFAVLDKVLKNFYEFPIQTLEKYSQENGIDYIVFQNEHLKAGFNCTQAFKNSYYTICKVPKLRLEF